MELLILMFKSFSKKICAAVFLFSMISFFLPAEASESAKSAFVQACNAYSRGDWNDAKILLKKVVSYSENMNPDVYYMLISAEVYAGDAKSALTDCNFYLETFPQSIYYPKVCYQKGKILYTLGEYEKSIIVMSDFCHRFEEDDLYSFALFYIGEALFAAYKYDEAAAIYERIVRDYPESSKAPAAQYRLESILQRGREEKLLYLLKQTGEEYLAAKEEYEKQLRLYNAESIDSTREKLNAAQKKNEELEEQISALEQEIAELKSSQDLAEQKIAELQQEEKDIPTPEPFDENKAQVRLLKSKAREIQRLLDEKKKAAANGGN